jgi:hypothetical protein
LAFALGVYGLYLPYLRFDHWSYARFLLPAIPLLVILMLRTLGDVLPPRVRGAGILLATCAFAGHGIHFAWDHQAFLLQSLDQHYPETARSVVRHVPPNAAVLTLQHSGSLRHYGHLLTLRWDVGSPKQFDGMVAWLETNGHPPYFLLEDEEVPRFRAQTPGSRYGDLAPLLIARTGSAALYRPTTFGEPARVRHPRWKRSKPRQ